MLENIPDVEENVPLPASATEAMPELSPKEELDMMARTAKMLSDITGEPLAPTEEHRGQAIQLAEQIVANKTDMNLAQYPNETIAYLAGMVAQYDYMVVRELADLKKYVVNKLLQETDNPDPKYRLPAVKALGEVDGCSLAVRVAIQDALHEYEKLGAVVQPIALPNTQLSILPDITGMWYRN